MHDQYQTGFMSKHEARYADGTTRSDYRTAHHGAGDPGYQTWLPETCTKCWQQLEAAQQNGSPVPTAPDQEVIDDPAA